MIQAKLSSLLLLAAGFIYITSCTQSNAGDMLQNDVRKREIIAAILVNDTVSSELMDSLMIKHHGEMMMKMNSMMAGDKMMQGDMMDKMMDMCKADSSMCKMMMGKTMDMCDMDKSKCSMMMGSMQDHPKAMKTMQDMGMCDMKGMKMDEKK